MKKLLHALILVIIPLLGFAQIEDPASYRLDETFGLNGTKLINIPGSVYDVASRGVALPDGKYLVAGTTRGASSDDIGVVRLNADGSIDPTFGQNGAYKREFSNGVAEGVEYVGLQSDGKIIIGATTVQTNVRKVVLIRLNADGTEDATFRDNGVAIETVQGGGTFVLEDMDITSDDRVVVTGYLDGVWNIPVLKFTADGELDTTFSEDGQAVYNFGGNEIPRGLTATSNGGVVVTGQQSFGQNLFFVLRVNPDGSQDSTFGDDGFINPNWAGTANEVGTDVIELSDGSLVACGWFGGFNDSDNSFMLKLQPNGNFDSTFGVNGIFSYDFSGVQRQESMNSLVEMEDGSFFGTGYYRVTNSNTSRNYFVAQISPTGELNTTFNEVGFQGFDFNGREDVAVDIDLMPSKDVMITGWSLLNSSDANIGLVRLTNRPKSPDIVIDSSIVRNESIQVYVSVNPQGYLVNVAEIQYSTDNFNFNALSLSGIVGNSGNEPVQGSATISGLSDEEALYYMKVVVNNDNDTYTSPVFTVYYQQDIPTENLAIWLQAGVGVTVENDSIVTEVVDLSSNGLRFTNESSRPSNVILQQNGLNGEPVFRFNNENVLVGDEVVDLTQGYTVFIVAKNDTVKDWNGLFRIAPAMVGSEADLEIYWEVRQGTNPAQNSGGIVLVKARNPQGGVTSASIANGAGPAVGNYYMLTDHVENKNGLHTRYMMGNLLPQTEQQGTSDMRLLRANTPFVGIGYGGPTIGNGYLSGNMAEIIVYKTGVDLTTLAAVHDYLNEKYFMEPVSVNDVVGLTPTEFNLGQNYPNPFNPTTTIRFALPEAAPVTLTIYNLLGQKVATLINNELMGADYHSVTFGDENLPSGMYLYRIQAGNYVSTRQMILLK